MAWVAQAQMKFEYFDLGAIGAPLIPERSGGILGKGGLFVAPPLEDCLTGLTGSSTQAGTGGTEL